MIAWFRFVGAVEALIALLEERLSQLARSADSMGAKREKPGAPQSN